MSDKEKDKNYFLSYGTSFRLPVGAGLGMLCGLLIGMLMDSKNKKK